MYMTEVPSKEQAKIIYAFIQASDVCKGVKGSEDGSTKRSLCIKEKILELIEKIPEEEMEKIHREVYKKIRREPEEANPARALTHSLQ
jgi:hypothetical protein